MVKLRMQNGEKQNEMNSALGKVTIRPREEGIKDMDVKGWPSWVKVPTFNLKGKPQGLEKANHCCSLCDQLAFGPDKQCT